MTVGSRPRFASSAERRGTESTRRYVSAEPKAPTPRPLNGAIVFVIAAALVAAVGMLYVLQTNHVATLGYEMSRLQDIRQEQAIENQRLKSTLAERRSLNDVRTIAVNQLGMEPAQQYRFVTVPRPASPEIVVPEPVTPEPESFWETFWRHLTGKGEAVNETERGASP